MIRRKLALILSCILAGSATGELLWQECPTEQERASGVDCTTLEVPMDWANPNGEKIVLSMNRLPASDQDSKIGSLVYNPGGPGDFATVEVAAFANKTFYMSDTLKERFDIIGLDTRGVGRSSPIKCDPDVYNKPASLYPETDAEFQNLIAYNKAFATSCHRLSGDLVKFVDTVSVARDLDAVRCALGDEKLNFLGESYGTQIAEAYLELFPDKVRTLVLDGVVDHSLGETSLHATETSAYELEYQRFVDWCDKNSSCPLYGESISQNLESLLKRAGKDGIPAPECESRCRNPVTVWDMMTQLQGLLIYKEVPAQYTYPGDWSYAASALKLAFNGNLTALATSLAEDENAGGWEGQMVNCLDWAHDTRSLADLRYFNIISNAYAPHTRGVTQSYTNSVQCIGWPFPVRDKARRIQAKETPQLLLVNAYFDDQTPYDWAVGAQRQLPNSVLLIRDGDGHTSYTLGGESSKYIDAYFVNLTLPAQNTVVDS